MTGDPHALQEITTGSNETVVFGDGARGNVIGKETPNVIGIPKLNNVMLVDGLKADLISINQLCDEGLHVKFCKENCLVFNSNQEKLMEENKSQDNCYMLRVKEM